MIQKQGRNSGPWSAKALPLPAFCIFLCAPGYMWCISLWSPTLPELTRPELEVGGGKGSEVSEVEGRKRQDWVLQTTSRCRSFLPSALSKAKTNTSGSSTNLQICLYSLRTFKPEQEYWRIFYYSIKGFLGLETLPSPSLFLNLLCIYIFVLGIKGY